MIIIIIIIIVGKFVVLIYMKQWLIACRKHIAYNKVVPSKSALTIKVESLDITFVQLIPCWNQTFPKKIHFMQIPGGGGYSLQLTIRGGSAQMGYLFSLEVYKGVGILTSWSIEKGGENCHLGIEKGLTKHQTADSNISTGSVKGVPFSIEGIWKGYLFCSLRTESSKKSKFEAVRNLSKKLHALLNN